ncbi:MAG: type 4 prepilin-like proteins leader peptide-processing enzyme [Candidatus Binatia bacterium]|nr:MAG: type 4 prepilin-like proteins leader peptide-processing enzyme [Candidatus Binatia bacterium]
MLYGFAFVFGAVIGSFLNVCIYRLPRGKSLLRPPSSCPKCERPIRPTDNLPILSYLLLRGRCRWCGVRIPPRYLFVESSSAALAVLMVARFGLEPLAVLYYAFAAALLVVTFVDLDFQIIPDSISLPGIAVGLSASYFVPGTPEPFDSAAGAVLGGAMLYLVARGYQWWTGIEGMGMGDVKLLAMIGAFVGWKGVLLCLFVAAFSGSVVGVAAIVFRGKDRKFAIPFGPFLAVGALVALFFGDGIVRWYLGLA